MGCGSSAVQNTKEIKKRQTVFGILEVRILDAHIQHQTTSLSQMDPYVKIKFSNQQFTGQVIKKGGKDPKFKDTFKFFVNSYYKFYGRSLELELMDSNIGSDSNIGYGIVDLDPYLNSLQNKSSGSNAQSVKSKPNSINLRCFLNYERQLAAIVNLQAIFIEQKTQILNFRFETADFKRSTRTFGDMQCVVRVSIGQQVLSTKKSKDTKTDKPVWKDQHLSFTVPISCDTVLFEVLDEQELIGSFTKQKLDFTRSDEEIQFSQHIRYKNQNAGKLYFSSKVKSSNFKQLSGDYKKRAEGESKKEQKKEENKQSKKEDKKEQKKQEKKQQKKEQKKQQKKQDPKEEKKQK